MKFRLLSLVLCFLSIQSSLLKAVDIIDLGVLSGGTESSATGVSANGKVVVGTSSTLNGDRAFRWTSETGMQDLGVLPTGTASFADGVSADGTVITGSSITASGFRAYRWNELNGMQELVMLAGGTASRAKNISNDGSIIVGYFNTSTTFYAFTWSSDKGMQNLGAPPGRNSSRAYSISGDGTTVVGASPGASLPVQGIKVTSEAGMESIGFPSGANICYAYDVSYNGSVIVGETGTFSTSYAFRYSQPEGFLNLGTLPGDTISEADAVSDDGEIIIGFSGNSIPKGFIWDNQSRAMKNLYEILRFQNVNGISRWDSISTARGISGDSNNGYNIVGTGIINGQKRGFLVTGLTSTVPEPSTYVLGLITMVFMMFLINRTKRNYRPLINHQ